MILYKYTSAKGMKAILDGMALLIRPADDYNDPFESLPAFDDRTARLVVENLLLQRRALKRLSEDVEILGQPYTVPKLRLLLRDENTRATIIDRLRKRSDMSMLDLAKSFQRHIAKSVGFVCLSSNPANLLMWSHYADEHQGFVFALDASTWDPRSIAKVEYSPRRASIPNKKPTEADVRPLVTTKSTDWSYEQEYRILCKETEWQTLDSRRVGYLDITPIQIKWICAGIRSRDDKVRILSRLAEEKHVTNPDIMRAEIDETEFRIKIPFE